MPVYEYQCPKCGAVKSDTRRVDDRDRPIPCWNRACWDDYHGEPAAMRRLKPSGVAIQVR